MHRGHYYDKEKHPRETTNFISKFSFFYMIELFKKGYTKGLHFDDLYAVLSSCRSDLLGQRLEDEWRKQKGSLSAALWRCFGKRFVILGVVLLVVRLVLTVWSPYAQSKVISYFSPGQTQLTRIDAVYYACVVVGINVFSLVFNHNFQVCTLELGLAVKAAVSSLIYRKSLRLRCEALSRATVGKVTTVINRDVEVLQQFVTRGNEIWIALVEALVICCLIYNKTGVASWAGVGFFFVILPLQMAVAKLAYNYWLECSKRTDERLEVIQEVLSAIKTIKMYAWETYFEGKICNLRKLELQQLFKLYYSRIWIHIIGNCCSRVAFFIFVITYSYLEEDVTAEVVYYILSCFNGLQAALSDSFAFGLSKTAETLAVIQRCEHILNCPESSPKVVTTDIVCPHISLSKGTVSLSINRGLNIVVGHVGSGKTTLLKTILKEYDLAGEVTLVGSVSYASQDPWLFPSSIKNNIIFGEAYSEKRYQQVLKVCGLDYDLGVIEGGDGTVVGDNLSKGQQARVNLARALYRNSDIYLLDDSLASLDADVSDHIFRECIQKFLSNKIRILVTNNCDYIEEAENIVVLEHGNIKSSNKVMEKLYDSSHPCEDVAITGDIGDRTPLYHEAKNPGKVTLTDYREYVSYGGGLIFFTLLMGLFIIHQATSSYSEKLLSNWITIEQNLSKVQGASEELYQERTWYCIFFLTAILLYLVRTFSFFLFIKTVSTNMHQAMLKATLNATMKFYDHNFIGNILTRFSKDVVTVDECLPFILIECLTMIFVASGAVALLTSVSAVFLAEFFLLMVVAYLIKKFCQPTGRNLQRLHVMARCPIVGHVNSSLTGLTTIRASNAEAMVIKEFDRFQDQYTSSHYMLDNSLVAVSFALEMVSVVFVAVVIVQLLAEDSAPSVGDVGLAITQAVSIISILANGIRVTYDCENLMTSVERMLEYIRLPPEDQTGRCVDNWPQRGAINVDRMSLKYTSKNTLKDVSFSLEPEGKLGIVGRTGSGKSSIVASLLRFYPISGKISIDGVDIATVSLHCLRNNISVIPQDPFLFSGTIRDNLDPLRQHSDEEIWKVLSDLRLKHLIPDLETTVDRGVSLSAGQRQLLCLVRVVLRKTKIVVLDEATANVDQETNRLISEAVLKNFDKCSVITIAHRLVSVVDCDRVIVMKDGEVIEDDEPKRLMQDKDSVFHSLVK